MNKKGIVVGAIAAIVALGIIASYTSSSSETVNLDMGRTHGDVSTAMGSPILGDPSAPITIVEFGDYQCHACYNWFHTHKPTIYENYIASGKAWDVILQLQLRPLIVPKTKECIGNTMICCTILKSLKLIMDGQILKD